MPYAFETHKLKIARPDDKRVKLSLGERKEIKKLYGTVSQRKLAKAFNVSRRLIIFIGDPEKHKQNLLARADTGGSSQYYNKDKQRAYIQKWRLHKKELFKENKLLK